MTPERPDDGRTGLVCVAEFLPPCARSKFEAWKRSIEGLVSIDEGWVVDFGRAAGGEFIRVWAPRHAATVLWKSTEAQLRIALAEVDLADTERALVAEFLDHNELGLAYESLTEAVGDRVKASSTALDALMSAAVVMAQDPPVGGDLGLGAGASPSD